MLIKVLIFILLNGFTNMLLTLVNTLIKHKLKAI